MRAVAPRTGAPEVTIAENQPEYSPLVGACYVDADGHEYMLTRWRFTAEERARIAAGEDLYLAELTFGRPFTPLMIQVGPEGWEVDATPETPAP